ncbi:integrase arm-type DNA-binding domain-containing protein [Sphingomonas sp. H39-1-10]|uniref:tyrosine-type recombinase/integrase n=1 Tax=Sphingomonas pollutisoli TaxID=3030829 RepID=UPI0023B9C90D|nr:site-specific integrase [Sphingomonas pollutisoli]MDF0487159.1 integrase arm-type DNA-binding domain-containing protein [Sphingomonas pollutisoli]
MPKKAAELSAMAVRNLSEPGMHFVGEVPGLALQILSTGAKTWVLRVKIGPRRRDMGLGGYPEVSLKDARDAARVARQKIREGVDPIEERRAAKSKLMAAATILTFKQAAADYISAQGDGWKNDKHRKQWTATLETYAYPTLGKLAVGDITREHVLAVLRPIWNEKRETASRLRGRIEVILDAAKAAGARSGDNPAAWRGNLDSALQRRRSEPKGHHAALPVADIGDFMKRLRAADGIGARALEFAILTAARSGEVRGATWSEIDLDAAIWIIPAVRMKAAREHRVPLSPSAVALLRALPRMAGNDLVFPAPRGGQLSDMTLGAVLKRMKVEATAHGFRSTFRDWAGEFTAHAREVIEHALAHQLKDKAEAAYARGDLLAKRKRLMDDWAAFVSKPAVSGTITPIRGRA